jgi:hypothetical protein
MSWNDNIKIHFRQIVYPVMNSELREDSFSDGLVRVKKYVLRLHSSRKLHKDYFLKGCGAMQFVSYVPTFLRKVPHSSSRHKGEFLDQLSKCRSWTVDTGQWKLYSVHWFEQQLNRRLHHHFIQQKSVFSSYSGIIPSVSELHAWHLVPLKKG